MTEHIDPEKDGIGAFRITAGTEELVVHEWGRDDAWLRSDTTAADLEVDAA